MQLLIYIIIISPFGWDDEASPRGGLASLNQMKIKAKLHRIADYFSGRDIKRYFNYQKQVISTFSFESEEAIRRLDRQENLSINYSRRIPTLIEITAIAAAFISGSFFYLFLIPPSELLRKSGTDAFKLFKEQAKRDREWLLETDIDREIEKEMKEEMDRENDSGYDGFIPPEDRYKD